MHATTKRRFSGASLIRSDQVTMPEMLFGYLLGPFLATITNSLFVSFLNRFYTDVLELTGAFITMLPLVSTILVVAGNLAFGVIIDRNSGNPMGKARPFLIVSAPLIFTAIVLMFAVPTGNEALMLVWIAVSYNLFFAVAYPCYFLAHSMMVPLSTRDQDQRGKLSVVSQMAIMGSSGLFVAILFPMFIYPYLTNKRAWLICMCIIAALAMAGILFEFFFTRERITEELQEKGDSGESEAKVPVLQQIRSVVTDRYWWMVIIFYLLFNLAGGLKNLSMSYYCDYILGSYQDGFTQSFLAAVTGIPAALGIVIAWPLARKMGKKNSIAAGLAFAVVGGLISLMDADNFIVVVIGVFIKTAGTIPACYVMMALFADVLDHLERKNGFRADGFSMSLYSMIMVGATGVVTAIFNGMISISGYAAPTLVDDVLVAAVQNDATQWVFIACFLGAETVAYAILAVVMSRLDVEKETATES